MSFRVDPEEIQVMSVHLHRCTEYLDAAIAYFENHVGSVGLLGTGILNPLSLEHPATTERVRNTLKHVRTILDKSSAEFVRVADTYRATDLESAARLDATYDAPGRVHPGKERY